ncbi:zinc carboxypeptidase [bacterium]|nr:zinc carboxypeptidase [bacterium]
MRKNFKRFATALGFTLSLTALAGCNGALQLGNSNSDKQNAQNAAESQAPRSQVRIYFRDVSQLEAASRAGVDLFENVDRTAGTVDALATAKGEDALKRLGIRYEVLEAPRTTRGAGLPSGYQTVEAVMADVKQVAANYPSIVRLETIGKSLQDRPLTAVHVTSKPQGIQPAVLITSGQHARELPPVELNMRLLKLLTEQYGKDPAITKLVDTRDIWLVPVLNPDGRTMVEGGSAMWRKNARNNGDGTRGVDTNRNADDHFEQGNPSTHADDYRGSAPFSEPESQAIRDLCAREKFTVSLDIHCYGGMFLWPPGNTSTPTKDEATFRKIGDHIAKPLGYRYGTINRTIYPTYADMATWQYNAHGILAFAAELQDPRFNPPFSQVDTDWKQWKDNLLYLIDVADSPRTRS